MQAQGARPEGFPHRQQPIATGGFPARVADGWIGTMTLAKSTSAKSSPCAGRAADGSAAGSRVVDDACVLDLPGLHG
jgi:hypothetical protein